MLPGQIWPEKLNGGKKLLNGGYERNNGYAFGANGTQIVTILMIKYD